MTLLYWEWYLIRRWLLRIKVQITSMGSAALVGVAGKPSQPSKKKLAEHCYMRGASSPYFRMANGSEWLSTVWNYLFRIKRTSLTYFCFASFSVESWGLEHSRVNKPYSDVITKKIKSRNTLEYSRNTHNVFWHQRCHHVNDTVPLRHLQQYTGLNIWCLWYYTIHVASCWLF